MQTPLPCHRAIRFSELSPQRRILVRLCQRTHFGFIRDLGIIERQPVFNPSPVVLVDLKLDSQDTPRPEIALPEFQLPAEVVRLMDLLDSMVTTTVESLEVRAGIPRRIVFRVSADSPANVDVATEVPEARR
jgi:hypothetical protein